MNTAELLRAQAREEHRNEIREIERRSQLETLAHDLIARYGRLEAMRILESYRRRFGV